MKQKQEKKNIAEVISLRGTGKIYLPDNVFEFIPTKKGEPLQKDVKKYGVAKAYTTTGKDPKRVITLQCPSDSTDPYAELTNQFKSVMKSEYKKDLPTELSPKGAILVNKDDVKMTINKAKRRIEASFFVPIDPQDKRDYKTMFYEKIQEISKCLAINETLIQKSR